MSGANREVSPPRVLVPQAPVVVAGFREVVWLTADGEIEALAPAAARSRIERETPMLCHARATARRLDTPVFPALDLLELFAFVRPARFCVPTPRGLADALGIDLPRRPAEECVTLASAARILLEELGGETDAEARVVADAMGRGGWLWAPAVLAALPACDIDARERAEGLVGAGPSTTAGTTPKRSMPTTIPCGLPSKASSTSSESPLENRQTFCRTSPRSA